MKAVKLFLLLLYRVYAITLFVVLLILLLPIYFIASFFKNDTKEKIVYRITSFWADVWFFIIFIQCKIINKDLPDKNSSYIFVANHISYIDAACIPAFIRQPLKPLGKYELQRVPLFGYVYKRVTVTIDRRSAQSRTRSLDVLRLYLQKGFSVLLFPEGTFNETEKPLRDFYNGAFKLAIEMQKNIKPFLLLDTHDRLNYKYKMALTPGKCRVLFLPEVDVKGLTISDMQSLKERVFGMMEEKLIEYKASWIRDLEG